MESCFDFYPEISEMSFETEGEKRFSWGVDDDNDIGYEMENELELIIV